MFESPWKGSTNLQSDLSLSLNTVSSFSLLYENGAFALPFAVKERAFGQKIVNTWKVEKVFLFFPYFVYPSLPIFLLLFLFEK